MTLQYFIYRDTRRFFHGKHLCVGDVCKPFVHCVPQLVCNWHVRHLCKRLNISWYECMQGKNRIYFRGIAPLKTLHIPCFCRLSLEFVESRIFPYIATWWFCDLTAIIFRMKWNQFTPWCQLFLVNLSGIVQRLNNFTPIHDWNHAKIHLYNA